MWIECSDTAYLFNSEPWKNILQRKKMFACRHVDTCGTKGLWAVLQQKYKVWDSTEGTVLFFSDWRQEKTLQKKDKNRIFPSLGR